MLLKWVDPNQQGVLTTKLFEYLAARRPILSFGLPDPNVDAIVRDSETGDVGKYSQREMARKFADVLTSIV